MKKAELAFTKYLAFLKKSAHMVVNNFGGSFV